MESPVNEIKNKLDAFIRRYYLNKLIKGLIYSAALLIILFIAVNVLEYFGRFTTPIRFTLFVSYLACAFAIIVFWIAVPLLKIKKLGKIISYTEAAKIVGQHFKNIEDKVLNILQLEAASTANSDLSLINAAIKQKTIELRPINFGLAINLNENKRYLKYAIIPLFIFITILVIFPNLITQSTTRILNYEKEFKPEAPFTFNIKQNKLETIQHEDFTIEVETNGKQLPAEVFIQYNGSEFKMQNLKNGLFRYTFNNLQKSTTFNFFAAGFYSEIFELKVLPKPIITNLEIELIYPEYTKKSTEIIHNTGDLNIPKGTWVKWKIKTENIDHLSFIQTPAETETIEEFKKESESDFSLKKRILKSFSYQIASKPNNASNANYLLNVINDAFPEIVVEEKRDSASNKRYYFNGQIKDDYGFTRLTFNYRFINKKDSSSQSKFATVNIPIVKDVFQTSFFYYWDLNNLNLKPEDELEYYFEIFDNDGVSGPKGTKSQYFKYTVPSLGELSKQKDESNKEIKKELTEAIEKAKKVQKQIKALEKKINDKKQLGWEEKKQIEDLLNDQKDLQRKVENLSKINQQQNQLNNEFAEPSQELLEKQKQLEELFEKVMTEDMKKMFQELQQILSNLEKNQVQDALEKMKLDNKELEKELDRNLELFKQLEFEQKLSEIADRLKNLAQKQEELSKETQNEKNPDKQKELVDKQEKLNREFEDLKKDYDDLQEKNKELENPHDLKNFDSKKDEIQNELNNSSNELKQKENKKASKSQKQAAQKMQEMANEMEKMQQEMEEQEAGEDYNTLRQILENLVQLSFSQENLITEVKTSDVNNPKFLKIGQTQRKLKDDAKIIEDSLLALSKRNPQISSVVNKEIGSIYFNMEKALDNLQERQLPQAASRQQFAMTSINNLALILSESLQQMQQQMQQQQKNSKGGSSSCKKPGKGDKPSMQSLRQMQQQLNEQLKKMREGLQQNGQKPGEKTGQNNTMSKEFAQMAAQQEALRQALQKAMQEGNSGKEGGEKDGGNTGNAKELRELAKKMEQTEQDLVNKNITPETLKRQQEILTRLLEAEKAEREREQDEKRKSNEAKKQDYSVNQQYLEYYKLKRQETELLRTVSPALNPYYKEIVNEYFNTINRAK